MPKPPCVLVVEDDRLIRQIVVAFLKRGGYTNIVEAGLAEEAIFHLFRDKDLQINAALIDLMLPNASGLTVIRKLRNSKRPWRRNLPIAVITSRTDTETYKMAARRGIQAYLLKPLSASLVNETVGKLLAGVGIRAPKPLGELDAMAGPPPTSAELPPTLDDAF